MTVIVRWPTEVPTCSHSGGKLEAAPARPVSLVEAPDVPAAQLRQPGRDCKRCSLPVRAAGGEPPLLWSFIPFPRCLCGHWWVGYWIMTIMMSANAIALRASVLLVLLVSEHQLEPQTIPSPAQATQLRGRCGKVL
jgi:hypothetical protein